jgi:trans-AT polyketide synthase/acyltransferase/oxidoreductase domain-containing protein
VKRVVWLFSGQGAQYFQMGRELFAQEPVFRAAIERLDAVVRPLLGESVADEIYRERADRFVPFRCIRHTHPAIVMVECALAELLLARGHRPDLIAGHSMGEVAAFVVAGAWRAEDVLVTVVKQGLLLEASAPPGGMLAVLGAPGLFTERPDVFAGCELAGVHFARSFVIGGPPEPLARARARLRELGVDTHELPLPHAFHVSSIDPLRIPLAATAAGLVPVPARQPVYSVGTRRRVTTPTSEHFWEATRARTDFPAAVRDLEADGPCLYVDLGPSGSFATAIKYNVPAPAASEFLPVMTPFGQERRALERLEARLQAR